MRKNFSGAVTAGLIVVGFCLILLWRDPLLFWNDDYELSILPVFADVARSWNEGQLPLLSPYSWVCSNLAGEFQYGTFSVFVNAAVILIWKFPLTFPQQAAALSITHLFVLAAGAFRLSRDRKFSRPLSIFVALVVALNGWIICWGAIDWLGALAAFAWLPWAWWGLERAQDRQRTRWRFLWPAPFVYLLVTGGFPYTVVMLALLLAWLSIKSLVQTRSLMSILPMIGGVALGFGLSAPAWLAIFDYVYGSARGVTSSSAHWQWIVPIKALPGLLLPCWTVNWADFSTRMRPHSAAELSCGLVAPAALLSFFAGRLDIRDSRIAAKELLRKIRWELVLLLLVLLLSMLPSAGVFRWSFRWLPFFHLILALCAAEVLRSDIGFQRRMPVSRECLVALLFVGITAVVMSILHTTGEYAFPLTWILLALVAIWILAEFALQVSSRREWIPVSITFAALLATYLCIPPNCGVPKYNLSQELTNPAPLDPQRLYLSLYPLAELNYGADKRTGPVGQVVRPGSTSMWAGLRFINGYSPILAAGVARKFNFSIHGEIDWSVSRDLLEKEAGPAGELARIGVDGIVIAPECGLDVAPDSGWDLVLSTEEGRVYHRNGAPYSRVRTQGPVAKISQINDSRNQVDVDVDVPSGSKSAVIEFMRPYFPGYVARLGGKKFPVGSYHGLFPTVELPAGSHGQLVLSYRPSWLIFGGGLSILSAAFYAVGVVAAAVLSSKKKKSALSDSSIEA